MGNTDSHSSFVSAAKPTRSLRFSSRREEVPSARGWWRSSQGSCRRSRQNQHTSWVGPKGSGPSPGPSPGPCSSVESGGSPKVLFRDGSMRVEFTVGRAGAVEPDGRTGLPAAPAADASARTSKGNSLSSDGSWYDSPWGPDPAAGAPGSPPGESISPGFSSNLLLPPAEANEFTSTSSGRTDDSGIGDSVVLQPDLSDFGLFSSCAASLDSVCSTHSALPGFPTPPDAASALLDDVIQEEAAGPEQSYSSLTLPSRRPESGPAGGIGRKDFLKNRIRRLSDWTGSLSRKKRRIQEPSSSQPADTSSSSLWSSNPLLNQNPFPPVQNIYHNFMQELETGCSSAAERTEPSEDEEEEEAGQLDVLFQQEQGAVRRAGWLCFKALLALSKDRKLEPAARRRWRRYWVTLKGCTLLFYETYGRNGSWEQELCPRHALPASDALVQAVPEHPKKEHVFCLSNLHGDVYLLQATSQTDLENWVTAIHSASASLLAKRLGGGDTLRLLRGQTRSLLHRIDLDGKMKKMAELQLSVIREPKSRKAVEGQIQQWEQNLEKLNLDLFRLRCYLSSLQGGELPNPKSLLAVASRASKSLLGRLGLFSASSLHALVCSRDEGPLRPGGGGRRRRLPPLKAVDGPNRSSRKDGRWGCETLGDALAPSAGCVAPLRAVEQLQVPNVGVFTLHICRLDAAEDFGFAVTGHVDGARRSHVYVSEVDPLGRSACEGLRAGDEVLAVNGASVSTLDLDLLQSLFSHQNLQLLLRRDEAPEGPSDPPAPLDPLTGASESSPDDGPSPAFDDAPCDPQNMERVYSRYQTFPEGRAVEVDVPKNPYSRELVLQPGTPTHLSTCQRLRKVIQELVDTEKSYVKDLVSLFDIYLTPLQTETLLSKDEMEALFGSLPEMLDFQRVFLQTLEERIASCPNFSHLETAQQFKKLLCSLGGSFLYYADHFKLYSGFCANHIKVQKVLERAKTDGAFKDFLDRSNPTNQHSSSLESYLIKPVQRVLKYPLLLRELVSLTDPESPEHTHLTEALRAMETVASHINDMQKIYEDYGSVFDQLAAEQSGAGRRVTDISMAEFLVHASVLWLNPLPCVGRLRKEPELTLFVFKRAVILVCRDSSKKRRTGQTSSRSADLDPFRFRWLIPVSAVQVRPANVTGSENPCVWELVHSRSEVEGRPETVFQLCSSGLEAKAAVLHALSCLLRDRAPSNSLRRRRRRRRSRPPEQSQGPDGVIPGDTCSEPLPPSRTGATAGGRTRLCSLTSELEAQLQRLRFVEAGAGSQETRPGDVQELERDFSVQSMASMVNEDCFYESVGSRTDAADAQERGLLHDIMA
ncbi:rho guanine nucleotide exchange factor TIAM2 isoform X2 [Betta splendens]|uniref:Rho guanine nucleotide exchange factor TIAM2 isoform X2 n=1 Tax=Betta splendens TaxID=158456 RepID=A0A6P7LTR5_BETSP|nr:rho guanine nucleotide exchange factor TIAM2 isoform X2 [Betta splendens]